MYAKDSARRLSTFSPAFVLWTLGCALFGSTAVAQPQVIRNITQASERLELTVNSSRILTLEKRIPRMVVNNPELLTVTALSANQVQLAARKSGVTQVNLWDEDGKVYTVDVIIYGDVRELELALDRIFPGASLNVIRLTNSLVLEGFVERPEDVGPIIRLAEDYAPKLVNNITVGGVQQVMLKVKVMEVSRTKLRQLGFDFAILDDSGSSVSSWVSGLLDGVSLTEVSGSGQTFGFAVLGGGDSFFGFLDALQQNNMAKILADPTITTISGRPAEFHVGGELPILVPSGPQQVTISWRDFGTRINFLPIVLGNGNIRLEVRSEVSEIDDTRGVVISGFEVPALKTSKVDTGVEMKAGQTLALAGLVQTRVEAVERGLPFLSDLPYIGAAFRRVEEQVNEIELIILVTPELVDAMDPSEVPPCGPGMESVSPTNLQLYGGGHLEVPSCGPCGPGCYGNCGGNCYSNGSCNGNCGGNCVGGCNSPSYSKPSVLATDAGLSKPSLPFQNQRFGEALKTIPAYEGLLQGGTNSSNSLPMYSPKSGAVQRPRVLAPTPLPATSVEQGRSAVLSSRQQPQLRYQMPAQYSRENPQYPSSYQNLRTPTSTPGLIGPIGYDIKE